MTPLFSLGAGVPVKIRRWGIGKLVEGGDAYGVGAETSRNSALEGGGRLSSSGGSTPASSRYLEVPMGPLKLSFERKLYWPEIGVTWRSTPKIATVPGGGSQVAFTRSVSITGSGEWLARSVTVQHNYLEFQASPASDQGILPAEKVAFGTYFKMNALVPAMVPIVAGAAALALYATGGQVLNWVQPGSAALPVH